MKIRLNFFSFVLTGLTVIFSGTVLADNSYAPRLLDETGAYNRSSWTVATHRIGGQGGSDFWSSNDDTEYWIKGYPMTILDDYDESFWGMTDEAGDLPNYFVVDMKQKLPVKSVTLKSPTDTHSDWTTGFWRDIRLYIADNVPQMSDFTPDYSNPFDASSFAARNSAYWNWYSAIAPTLDNIDPDNVPAEWTKIDEVTNLTLTNSVQTIVNFTNIPEGSEGRFLIVVFPNSTDGKRIAVSGIFVQSPYFAVNARSSDEGLGIVKLYGAKEAYEDGETATITLKTRPVNSNNAKFIGWSLNGTIISTEPIFNYSGTVTSNLPFVAEYEFITDNMYNSTGWGIESNSGTQYRGNLQSLIDINDPAGDNHSNYDFNYRKNKYYVIKLPEVKTIDAVSIINTDGLPGDCDDHAADFSGKKIDVYLTDIEPNHDLDIYNSGIPADWGDIKGSSVAPKFNVDDNVRDTVSIAVKATKAKYAVIVVNNVEGYFEISGLRLYGTDLRYDRASWVAIAKKGNHPWGDDGDGNQNIWAGGSPMLTLDGDDGTGWHSNLGSAMPQYFVVDMKESKNVGQITVRPVPSKDGNWSDGGWIYWKDMEIYLTDNTIFPEYTINYASATREADYDTWRASLENALPGGVQPEWGNKQAEAVNIQRAEVLTNHGVSFTFANQIHGRFLIVYFPTTTTNNYINAGEVEVYSKPTASVSVASNNSTFGSIVSNADELYPLGEPAQFTLSATPVANYSFLKWQLNGEDYSTDPTLDWFDVVTENMSFTAVFEFKLLELFDRTDWTVYAKDGNAGGQGGITGWPQFNSNNAFAWPCAHPMLAIDDIANPVDANNSAANSAWVSPENGPNPFYLVIDLKQSQEVSMVQLKGPKPSYGDWIYGQTRGTIDVYVTDNVPGYNPYTIDYTESDDDRKQHYWDWYESINSTTTSSSAVPAAEWGAVAGSESGFNNNKDANIALATGTSGRYIVVVFNDKCREFIAIGDIKVIGNAEEYFKTVLLPYNKTAVYPTEAVQGFPGAWAPTEGVLAYRITTTETGSITVSDNKWDNNIHWYIYDKRGNVKSGDTGIADGLGTATAKNVPAADYWIVGIASDPSSEIETDIQFTASERCQYYGTYYEEGIPAKQANGYRGGTYHWASWDTNAVLFKIQTSKAGTLSGESNLSKYIYDDVNADENSATWGYIEDFAGEEMSINLDADKTYWLVLLFPSDVSPDDPYNLMISYTEHCGIVFTPYGDLPCWKADDRIFFTSAGWDFYGASGVFINDKSQEYSGTTVDPDGDGAMGFIFEVEETGTINVSCPDFNYFIYDDPAKVGISGQEIAYNDAAYVDAGVYYIVIDNTATSCVYDITIEFKDLIPEITLPYHDSGTFSDIVIQPFTGNFNDAYNDGITAYKVEITNEGWLTVDCPGFFVTVYDDKTNIGTNKGMLSNGYSPRSVKVTYGTYYIIIDNDYETEYDIDITLSPLRTYQKLTLADIPFSENGDAISASPAFNKFVLPSGLSDALVWEVNFSETISLDINPSESLNLFISDTEPIETDKWLANPTDAETPYNFTFESGKTYYLTNIPATGFSTSSAYSISIEKAFFEQITLPYDSSGLFSEIAKATYAGTHADVRNNGAAGFVVTVTEESKLTIEVPSFYIIVYNSRDKVGQFETELAAEFGVVHLQVKPGTYFIVIDDPNGKTNISYDLSIYLGDKTITDLKISDNSKVIKSITYFDVQGRPLSQDAKGLLIRKIQYEDGDISIEKYYRK